MHRVLKASSKRHLKGEPSNEGNEGHEGTARSDKVCQLDQGPHRDAISLSYRHVLVPLDGSALGAHALPIAQSVSDRLGADVHTISVANDRQEADRMRDHASSALRGSGLRDRVHVAVGADIAPRTGWRIEVASSPESTGPTD